MRVLGAFAAGFARRDSPTPHYARCHSKRREESVLIYFLYFVVFKLLQPMKKLLLLLALSSSLLALKAQTALITTVAGSSKAGYYGDGMKATMAQFNQNGGVAVDDSGNVYIADSQNNRIRKVYKKNGVIVTIVGDGKAGYIDTGKAVKAECSYPIGMRVDSLRNVYFADAGNAVIRMVDAGTGRIYTIAGSGIEGYSGDSGLATKAKLHYPVGIALDKNLNVYIADQSNNVIRKVELKTGIITTVAGNHTAGYSGNGGQATVAQLNSPTGVAVDRSGTIYIADFKNNVIRAVNKEGIIRTFAGTHDSGFNGFEGVADTSRLFNPAGVSTDAAGNVYIADAGNGVVREVFAATKHMQVLAGTVADGFSGDGGPATAAQISYPFDIVADKKGNIYVADLGNNRVRKIYPGPAIQSHPLPSKATTPANPWLVKPAKK